MSPRPYAMRNRGAAVEATRKRIVAAAVRLHSRRGTAATTWDHIAAEAKVSRATVYHHFPSLDALVPACAQLAFEVIEMPTAAEATARFATLSSPRARLAHLVSETCRCYSSGAPWLRAAWRERDVVPPMAAAVRRLQKAMDVLLTAALEGVSVTDDSRRVVTALVDFPFWDALDRSRVRRTEIANCIVALAWQQLEGGRTET